MIKEFRIGGIKYGVEVVDQLRDGNALLYGQHIPVEAKIKIAKNVSERNVNKDVIEVTYYHELLHAFIHVAAFKFPDEEMEEDFVERLSYVFLEYEQSKK